MFILSYFFNALAIVISFILNAYMWIIIGRAIISWVNADPYNPIVRFLYDVTEPVLYRIRRYLPVSAGPIDFSPMLVILLIMFLLNFLVPTLHRIAIALG